MKITGLPVARSNHGYKRVVTLPRRRRQAVLPIKQPLPKAGASPEVTIGKSLELLGQWLQIAWMV